MTDSLDGLLAVAAALNSVGNLTDRIQRALAPAAAVLNAQAVVYWRSRHLALENPVYWQQPPPDEWQQLAQKTPPNSTGVGVILASGQHALILPVRIADTHLGVLMFVRTEFFSDAALKLARLVATQLGTTVQMGRWQHAEQQYRNFAISFSQEIRGPLTPLKGYADLMLLGGAGQLSEMQTAFLRTMRENADRMMILVNGVLNIAKLETGEHLQLKIEKIALPDLLETTLHQCLNHPYHARKNMNVSLLVAEGVPPIEADYDKLVLVMTNIVDNALHYTKAGGRVDISAETTQDGKYVQIAVADTGIGIADEYRELVWQRFERNLEDALSMGVIGAGLGLTLVRELVRLHRGSVWFNSMRGKGTTFYVQLPIKYNL